LTRRDDEFVPLNERSGRANQIKPHFFISIHQNHISQSTISGSEIYFYRGDKESEKLASIIMSYLVKETATLNRGVKTADFYLLRDVRSSSLHIEVAYLSNPIEEEKLQREEYLKTVARAIAAGIQSYYSRS
jgi:N-acetylmuramoyl-L-alanine amidase